MRKLTVAVLGVLVSACLTQTGHAQEKRKRASGGSQATTTASVPFPYQSTAICRQSKQPRIYRSEMRLIRQAWRW